MKHVKVYSTLFCGYCIRAKQFLQSKNIPFEEIDLSFSDGQRHEFVRTYNWRTVPVIFIGEKFIGGYEELLALDRSKELDALLQD